MFNEIAFVGDGVLDVPCFGGERAAGAARTTGGGRPYDLWTKFGGACDRLGAINRAPTVDANFVGAAFCRLYSRTVVVADCLPAVVPAPCPPPSLPWLAVVASGVGSGFGGIISVSPMFI